MYEKFPRIAEPIPDQEEDGMDFFCGYGLLIAVGNYGQDDPHCEGIEKDFLGSCVLVSFIFCLEWLFF